MPSDYARVGHALRFIHQQMRQQPSLEETAAAMERPVSHARAVAGAVAANPVSVLIPCHRVIRGSGKLGGYRWGLERKERLLRAEGAQ